MLIRRAIATLVLLALAGGCATSDSSSPTTSSPPTAASVASTTASDPVTADPTTASPPASSTESSADGHVAEAATPNTAYDTPGNVYGRTATGDMSPLVADAKPLVYVPSNDDGSVTVIDQKTKQIVRSFTVGKLVQHVVPDWDLKTVYATASGTNQLVPIDPATGDLVGKSFHIDAPYNLYFSPDGQFAIVMAERRNRIDYYERSTWTLKFSIGTLPCKGPNHADWTPDGSWFVVTCEFSGEILKVESATGTIINRLSLGKKAMPQDLRLTPDGSKFYVADMNSGGVWVLDETGTKILGSIKTGVGTHGIYPSRDATVMYVSNRGRTEHDSTQRKSKPGEGSVSVVDPKTDKVLTTWSIPGGGSPDMGGVTADGTELWLSGRYDSEVYVFDTTTGEVKATIQVPKGPHGLCVFPQPGRYSLGHTGNYR